VKRLIPYPPQSDFTRPQGGFHRHMAISPVPRGTDFTGKAAPRKPSEKRRPQKEDINAEKEKPPVGGFSFWLRF